MKIKLIEFLQRVSNLGVDDRDTLFDQQRVRLLNQIMLIALTLQVFLIIEGILLRDFGGVLFGIIMMGICVTPLYLTSIYKVKAAIWFFCIYAPLSMASIIILYGEGIKINYSYIIFAVHLMIFLTTTRDRLIFTSFVVLIYFLAYEYTRNFASPFARDFNFFEENAIFISCLLFIIFVLKSYTDLVKANFIKIESLFEEQTSKNQIIEKQNKDLLVANSELEKFAYIASHDLKSPLRNVSSFISLIERKLKRGQTDGLLEDLGYAKRASQQMYSLIEDILRYSRMREQELSFKPVNLKDTITQVAYSLQTIFEEKNVELTCEELAIVEANNAQLVLLFQNLIENGIKYNKSTKPTIQIARKEKNEEYIIISVKDNGIGIPKNYQTRVFEMFARLHNQQDYEGTGLGLAICKRIVNAHGGDISLKSKAGKGSTFYIQLPILQNKEFSETGMIEKTAFS